MKKKIINVGVLFLVVLCNGCAFGSTQSEKEQARQKIAALKEQIKREEKAYNAATRRAASEQEKEQLTTRYYQDRLNLFQQIAQQRDIINARSLGQWLWDGAKVVGPLAMIGWAAYQLLQSPSKTIESPAIISEPQIMESKTVESEPAKIEIATETPVQFFSVVENEVLPLPKEQYEKYKNAANRYGYASMALSWLFLFTGSPIFIPFIASTYGGSLYNGMKGLQLKLKPYLYPISLEQIQIKPAEMPY